MKLGRSLSQFSFTLLMVWILAVYLPMSLGIPGSDNDKDKEKERQKQLEKQREKEAKKSKSASQTSTSTTTPSSTILSNTNGIDGNRPVTLRINSGTNGNSYSVVNSPGSSIGSRNLPSGGNIVNNAVIVNGVDVTGGPGLMGSNPGRVTYRVTPSTGMSNSVSNTISVSPGSNVVYKVGSPNSVTSSSSSSPNSNVLYKVTTPDGRVTTTSDMNEVCRITLSTGTSYPGCPNTGAVGRSLPASSTSLGTTNTLNTISANNTESLIASTNLNSGIPPGMNPAFNASVDKDNGKFVLNSVDSKNSSSVSKASNTALSSTAFPTYDPEKGKNVFQTLTPMSNSGLTLKFNTLTIMVYWIAAVLCTFGFVNL